MLQPFIDAHVHLNTNALAKLDLVENRNAYFLSINTDIPFFQPVSKQETVIRNLQKEFPGRIQYVCSFDNTYWNTDQWLPHVMKQIKQGVANGAVGVKIWKNIGMDVSRKDTDGNFVFVDDDRFDPIYEYITENDLLLLGHQGEPKNCWLPLDEMTMESDRNYFGSHPEYHMYLQSEFPSYEQQMAARDHMLEKHPQMKYIGLHLFSMEWNLDEVASRLRKFPNTKTDLAERICHVQYQAMTEYEKVRDFFIEFQDRIIYGTDVIDDGSMSLTELSNHFKQLWDFHYDFFATSKTLTAPEFEGQFSGLQLPKEVVEKLFIQNAISTYGFSQH